MENATDHDKEVVILTRQSSKNLLTTAVGLLFDKTNRTLTLKGALSQTANMVEIQNSVGTVLNSFNERGVLDKAGRIYYQSSTPAPNAADTGLLWFNTTDSNLYVWNGTSWAVASGGVTLSGSQTISGAKTFSTDITLSSSARIKGSGTSKSLIFQPTSSIGVPTTQLTLTDTTAVVAGELDFSAVGTTAQGVVVCIEGDQTVNGKKTFSDSIIAHSGIITSTSTVGDGSSDNIVLKPNLSTSGRAITIYNNANSVNGISIRPKNGASVGSLAIDGNTAITGNLSVTGSIASSTPITVQSTAIGSWKSSSGSANAYNLDFCPTSLGQLSFTALFSGTRTVTITNTSSTSSVTFYFRREQLNTNTNLLFTVHRVTLEASGEITIAAVAGTATGTGYTYTPVTGGYYSSGYSQSTANQPIVWTVSLGN